MSRPKPYGPRAAAPQGKYAYDFGDTGKMTTLMKTHTLGHLFMPAPDHAGGLRYHAMSPIISHLKEIGELDAVACRPGPRCRAAAAPAALDAPAPAAT